MKFRKKRVVIEAVKYNFKDNYLPEGVCGCLLGDKPRPVHIHTLEGLMIVRDGDWIITGIKGEHYPCKPDIFEATYEPVRTNTGDRPTICDACGYQIGPNHEHVCGRTET